MRVHTEADFPQQWADLQNNLAFTFIELAQETQFIDFAKAACERFAEAERGYSATNRNDQAVQARASLTYTEAVIKQSEEASAAPAVG